MKSGLKQIWVFDLDGTLIDSIGDLNLAANRLLSELGRAPVAIDAMRPMVGDGVGKLVERVLAARPGPEIGFDEAVARFLGHYEKAPAEATRPYPGVPETLAALRNAGCRLAVCTNKPEAVTRLILDRLKLAPYFELVIGGDTMPYRKPDPRLLTVTVERMGAPLDAALMIGDSEVDAATAAAAAVPFVLMTYGYRRGPVETIECTAALDRFEALIDLVRTSA